MLSQCIHVSTHHVVYLKYLTALFVHYTSIKLKKRSWIERRVMKGESERLLPNTALSSLNPEQLFPLLQSTNRSFIKDSIGIYHYHVIRSCSPCPHFLFLLISASISRPRLISHHLLFPSPCPHLLDFLAGQLPICFTQDQLILDILSFVHPLDYTSKFPKRGTQRHSKFRRNAHSHQSAVNSLRREWPAGKQTGRRTKGATFLESTLIYKWRVCKTFLSYDLLLFILSLRNQNRFKQSMSEKAIQIEEKQHHDVQCVCI